MNILSQPLSHLPNLARNHVIGPLNAIDFRIILEWIHDPLQFEGDVDMFTSLMAL